MEPERISKHLWRLPTDYKAGMRVPGLVFANEHLIKKAEEDRALDQVANVAFLPGIVGASIAMPDIHWGYGFPIGGVAATDPEAGGVISPGGVGFDINCGVRLVKTNLRAAEVANTIPQLLQELGRNIPKGVGSKGRIKVRRNEMEELMVQGVAWAIGHGYGWAEDAELCEEGGRLEGADPSRVSGRAFERGADQVGTLGSGNHFLEVQVVEEIYERATAESFGLFDGQMVVMIHSGSRGVGHQIATDYLKIMDRVVARAKISLPDRQLAAAPVDSPEGRDYLAAMACAVNFAFVNRQALMYWARDSFEYVFKRSAKSMGMHLLYDVCHNIAKFEEHEVEGARKRLCVHRKGATRAFGPGHAALPQAYRETGQPVLIPGDMETGSYVLVGTEESMKLAWGSACHGAGRLLSRGAAKRQIKGDVLRRELEERGIIVIAGHMGLLAEEAPAAYKDVGEVVEITHEAGLARKVARLRPLGVVKG
ncbi:MAG: RtcB family protein [Actinobacteria bacterium]|nr:RtcB family protein [Actinomycetota bacterium]